MKRYVVKMPKLVTWFYPKRIWAFSNTSNSVYLTFDDGPIPEVTPWVLEQLKLFNAKATFFCIGNNVKTNPSVFQEITTEGHAVGNHTFDHLNGWKTNTSTYLENCSQSETLFDSLKQKTKSPLFRPPFGKMTSMQAKLLQREGFQIVMWDVLSGDFDTTITEEECLQNVIQNIQPGSIVVFHDSLKAEKKLRHVLPKVLKHISDKGWKCDRI